MFIAFVKFHRQLKFFRLKLSIFLVHRSFLLYLKQHYKFFSRNFVCFCYFVWQCFVGLAVKCFASKASYSRLRSWSRRKISSFWVKAFELEIFSRFFCKLSDNFSAKQQFLKIIANLVSKNKMFGESCRGFFSCG